MVTAALGFDMTYARVGLPSKGHGGAEARGDCGGRTRSAVEIAARGRESSGGGGGAPAGGGSGSGRRGMGGKRTVEDCGALPLHSSTNEATRTVRLRSRGNASDHVVGRSRSTAG
jgi:hypothetical protein